MQQTVWVISGNRGGVGKSLLAVALASCLMSVARRQVSVLDGDGRSPDVFDVCTRKIPARWADFRRLRPDRYDDMPTMDYVSIVENLLNVSSDVIINTPDGADDVLMEWFDSTLRCTESANCTFKLLYMMNHRGNGLDILPKMSSHFAYLFPIKNLYFAHPEAFVEFDKHYADGFLQSFEFPKLRDIEVTRLIEGRYLPNEFVEARGGSLLARQRVKDWMAQTANIFLEILETNVANSKSIPLYNASI